MTKSVVLWISRRKAIIVSTTDGVEEILRVKAMPLGQAQGAPEDRRAEYYERVIHAMLDAQSIFIFGPAQAKMELKSHILKVEALSHRVMGTETATTMTEDQLLARAREMSGP
jgi:stalled ribosome rescue protein Dom34